jgi:hypothetical protein
VVPIVEERRIKAAPERVWGALTQPDEMARWWANEARVEPVADSVADSVGEFHLRQPVGVRPFAVAELEQDRHVRWMSWQGPAERSGRWPGLHDHAYDAPHTSRAVHLAAVRGARAVLVHHRVPAPVRCVHPSPPSLATHWCL